MTPRYGIGTGPPPARPPGRTYSRSINLTPRPRPLWSSGSIITTPALLKASSIAARIEALGSAVPRSPTASFQTPTARTKSQLIVLCCCRFAAANSLTPLSTFLQDASPALSPAFFNSAHLRVAIATASCPYARKRMRAVSSDTSNPGGLVLSLV